MIYDLYSSDHEEDFDNKEATKNIFDEGIQLYQAGDFMKARYQFRKVIDVNHDDLVAQKYYFLADEYKLKSKNEIPHWSPILT
jgi:TolA-binding protein